jgi:hypothetical protein
VPHGLSALLAIRERQSSEIKNGAAGVENNNEEKGFSLWNEQEEYTPKMPKGENFDVNDKL